MPNNPFTVTLAATLFRYLAAEAPQMAARETLKFIDDNFRLQGWQGQSFRSWAPIKASGAILDKTGLLRRSFSYNITGAGEVYFYNNLPYAKAHNEGFKGAVNVRAYTRTKSIRTNAPTKNKGKVKAATNQSGETTVNGYTRNANIIRRQFAPTNDSQSQILNKAIINELEKNIKGILTI